MANYASAAADNTNFLSSFNNFSPYPPCVLPANELKPIAISQIEVNNPNRGKRTVIRVITAPQKLDVALTAMVMGEDTVACLVLYCQPFDEVVPAKQSLRPGSCYLIKEPLAVLSPYHTIVLRVDHPSDIFLLPFDHEFVPAKWQKKDVLGGSSREIRMKGNDAVGKEQWAEAEDLYSAAIRVAETAEEYELAYLNRSLVNLRLGRPATALADAAKSSGTDNLKVTEKGLLREASALYDLAKYDQSFDKIQTLKAKYPTNNSAMAMMDRVQARLKEQQTGQYDFRRMYEQAKATPPLIDCATYTTPVEIRDSPGKGRGVFTTRKVLAGDILICEKAFGYAYAGKDHSSSQGMTKKDVSERLRTQIVQRLFHNIEDARLFNDLHHGDYDAVGVFEVDGKPVVDSSLVANVIALTSCRGERDSISSFQEILSGKQNGIQNSLTTGVWTFMSYINHSCNCNAASSFIGDVQIIRATRDLDAETEILVPYTGFGGLESYDKVQELLSHWGFTCDCVLCLDRKATSEEVFLTRKALLRDFNQCVTVKDQPINIPKAQNLVDRLDQTYSAAAKESGAFKLHVWYCCQPLGSVLVVMGNHIEAIEVTLKGLEAIGFVISANPRTGREVTTSSKAELRITQWGLPLPFCVVAFQTLYLAYKTIAPENAEVARGYMEIAYSMWVGEKDTFLDTCRNRKML